MAFKNSPSGKSKMMRPMGPKQVIAKDPITGRKATGLTKAGARFELEFKVGKKVPHPKFTTE